MQYNLPYFLVFYLAVIVHWIAWKLSPIVTINTTFSPSRVALAGTHHWYSSAKVLDLRLKTCVR